MGGHLAKLRILEEGNDLLQLFANLVQVRSRLVGR
jgi:hypothetical protein